MVALAGDTDILIAGPAAIVHVNEVLPEALAGSVAVTVTVALAAFVGVPEISPPELIVNPVGNPVAVYVQLHGVLLGSVAAICRLTVCPAVVVWLPGLVTLTLLGSATTGWLTSHPPLPPLKSLAHVDWTANVPVVREMFCDAP
jgi:hypothetical protein